MRTGNERRIFRFILKAKVSMSFRPRKVEPPVSGKISTPLRLRSATGGVVFFPKTLRGRKDIPFKPSK
jgi:hypothetical protein